MARLATRRATGVCCQRLFQEVRVDEAPTPEDQGSQQPAVARAMGQWDQGKGMIQGKII